MEENITEGRLTSVELMSSSPLIFKIVMKVPESNNGIKEKEVIIFSGNAGEFSWAIGEKVKLKIVGIMGNSGLLRVQQL